MNKYNLGFISDEDIYNHVKTTVLQYRKNIDLKEFNKNIIDPIKMTFDAKIYGEMSKDYISYFHQRIFNYVNEDWTTSNNGFDVVNKKRHIYSLFTDSRARKSADDILKFLRDVQEEDKYLTDGYAKRLVQYFCAMSRLRYIEENMSAYARYFYPYSGKSSETSYIKTFNNAKAPILSSSELDVAIEKIRNIAES